MKTVRPVIGSNGIPYLQKMSIRLPNRSGIEGEGESKRGEDGRKGPLNILNCIIIMSTGSYVMYISQRVE